MKTVVAMKSTPPRIWAHGLSVLLLFGSLTAPLATKPVGMVHKAAIYASFIDACSTDLVLGVSDSTFDNAEWTENFIVSQGIS